MYVFRRRLLPTVVALSSVLCGAVRANRPFAAEDPALRALVFPPDAQGRALVESLASAILREYEDALLVSLPAQSLALLEERGIAARRLGAPTEVLLRGGTFDLRAFPLRARDLVRRSSLAPVLIALHQPPDEASLSELEALGVRIEGSIPESSLLARVLPAALPAIASSPLVATIAAYMPEWRISPRVAMQPEAQTVEVVLFAGESAAELADRIALSGPVAALVRGERELLLASLDAAGIRALAEEPEVEWIDVAPQGAFYNDRIRVLMQTSCQTNLNPPPPDLMNPIYNQFVFGLDQVIAVTDTGIEPCHDVFLAPGKIQGHYVPNGSCATLGDPFSHGTPIACTAAGDSLGPISGGYFTPNDLDGVAVGASLIIQDIEDGSGNFCLPANVVADVFQRAFDEGARVHNNSWGTNGGMGTYSGLSYAVDEFLADDAHRESVFIFAVPDEGPCLYALSDESHAKNAIAVGGCRNGHDWETMYTFSSRGPTSDGRQAPPPPGTCIAGPVAGTAGRVKPDLVAPGSGVSSADSVGCSAYFGPYFGTSFAAPAVSGAAALVRDYLAQGIHPRRPSYPSPSSALVKAMLINSAVELTSPSARQSGSYYPNFDQGYGRPALANTLEPAGYRLLEYFEDAGTSVAMGEVWSTHLQFPATIPLCTSLRATLVWIDPAPVFSAGKVLVNDLDLEVVVGGQAYRGNFGLTGGAFDRLNNVEDVNVLVPDFGPLAVDVRVLGASVVQPTEQRFALVVTYGLCQGVAPEECSGGGCYCGPTDTVPGAPPGLSYCCGPGQTFDPGEFGGGFPTCGEWLLNPFATVDGPVR